MTETAHLDLKSKLGNHILNVESHLKEISENMSKTNVFVSAVFFNFLMGNGFKMDLFRFSWAFLYVQLMELSVISNKIAKGSVFKFLHVRFLTLHYDTMYSSCFHRICRKSLTDYI